MEDPEDTVDRDAAEEATHQQWQEAKKVVSKQRQSRWMAEMTSKDSCGAGVASDTCHPAHEAEKVWSGQHSKPVLKEKKNEELSV